MIKQAYMMGHMLRHQLVIKGLYSWESLILQRTVILIFLT